MGVVNLIRVSVLIKEATLWLAADDIANQVCLLISPVFDFRSIKMMLHGQWTPIATRYLTH